MDAAVRKKIEARLEHLSKLGGGRLTPDAVVADARSKSSPLHGCFTWDDSEAAKQWRLQEARELIRSVRVEVKTEERTLQTVRYVRDPEAGDEQGYVELTKLRDAGDIAREALRRELASVNAAMSRAESIAEALGMKADVIAVREQFDQLRMRVA